MLIRLRNALAVICTLMLVSALALPLAAEETPPDQDEPSGYMDPDERSPAAALNPAESGLEIWIGPIIMGVFAFFLILFIRRYSKTRRQDQAQKDPENPPD